MSIGFKDKIGLNGTYLKTIYICENNDIYIPFDDGNIEIFETNDSDVLTNYNCFIENYSSMNVLIDSRLVKTICYISNIIDNVLIYNVNNNEVISFSRYVIDKIGTTLNVDECKEILNLYIIVTFFIKLTWNCDLALKCVRKIKNIEILHGAFYLPYIIEYINEINNRINKGTKIVKKMKYVDIASKIKMKDGLTKITESIEDILYSLREIDKESHFILF